MPDAQIRYVIFVDQKGDEDVMLAAPLEPEDREYFATRIVPALQPMSDEQYMDGPAVILHTMARFSYILHGSDVYWCSEWAPGLIVVRLSPTGALAWAAFRSPVADFGGRTPSAEDLRNPEEEDAENHQYNLVFKAWDAQFDEDWRKWRSFKRADARTVKGFRAALKHVESLGGQLETRYSDDAKRDRWMTRCKRNLEKWAGEGVRVRRP